MLEGDYRALQETSRVLQRSMRLFINQHVRKVACESLGDGQVAQIPTAHEQCLRRAEEPGEFLFQFVVQRVIPSGHPRGGDAHPAVFAALGQGRKHFGVASKAEIIATGEIGKLPTSVTDVGAPDLLQRFRLDHEGELTNRLLGRKANLVRQNSMSEPQNSCAAKGCNPINRWELPTVVDTGG